MNISEMLDECKKRLNIKSDYALAKEFEIKPARIYSYRNGSEHPDTYVCFRIAEILEISPSSMIAQVEAKTTKNETKALFFKRFFSIMGLWITLGLLSPNYSGLIDSASAHGNENNSLILIHKSTLCETLFRKFMQKLYAFFGKFLPLLYV
jgi:hypothetical protein